jgi:hypothetical protein
MLISIHIEVTIVLFPLKLRTIVKTVTPIGSDKGKTQWKVVTEDVETTEQEEHEFDAVMVCNG